MFKSSPKTNLNQDTANVSVDKIKFSYNLVEVAIDHLKSGYFSKTLWQQRSPKLKQDANFDQALETLQAQSPAAVELINYLAQVEAYKAIQGGYYRLEDLAKGLQDGSCDKGFYYEAGQPALIAVAVFAEWWNGLTTPMGETYREKLLTNETLNNLLFKIGMDPNKQDYQFPFGTRGVVPLLSDQLERLLHDQAFQSLLASAELPIRKNEKELKELRERIVADLRLHLEQAEESLLPAGKNEPPLLAVQFDAVRANEEITLLPPPEDQSRIEVDLPKLNLKN